MERSISIEASVSQNEENLIKEKATVKDYITVTKPGLSVANLLATLAGFMLGMAGQPFSNHTFISLFWTLLGTALVIASGTTLNNVLDRDIDKYMERTKSRPVTNHRISPRVAAIYGLVLAVIGEAVLTFGANPLAAVLGFIGLFVYVVVYTAWLKRTTTLNTVIGGLSGAMPPLVGYVAITNTLDITAWTVLAFMFLWQPPHFLALAMRRVEEYRGVNIPMLPVVIGFDGTKRQILWYTVAMVPVSLFLYHYEAVGQLYLWVAGILGLIYLALAVQGLFIKKEKDIPWANLMFKYSIIYLTAIFILMMVDAK